MHVLDRRTFLFLVGIGLFCVPVRAENTSTTPVSREGNWMKRHESFNQRAQQGDVDLVFVGDSITEGWNNNEVWKKYYGSRKAFNIGVSGDRTEHVLWRLDNGNVDGIKPKLVVVMIGTNNSNGDECTAEEIAAGIKAVVARLREKLPESKVLILAIFPRGKGPNPQREKNARASEMASQVADNRQVFYLDIGPKFLADDGTISAEIMDDYLHLTLQGYQIWAEAIEAKVAELLGEK